MTTTSLATAAQGLLDLYYQDYAPENAFIELGDVQRLMSSEYERLLQAEYERAKLMAKAVEGFTGVVEMDTEVTVIETLKVAKEGRNRIAILTNTAFSFGPFDSMSSGVQRAIKMGDTCGNAELIRIGANDVWGICLVPQTNKIFYYPQTVSTGTGCPVQTRLMLLGDCVPAEIEVQYIPGLDAGGDMQIATRFVKRVTDAVLQTLLIAKQQVVVDKTNDGNPNTTLATEVNPDNMKPNP